MVALPNLHHFLPVRGELLDGVDAVVGGQDGIVVGDVQAVGAVAELALAKGAQEVAVLVEDHYRMLAPGQDKHPVLGIADHAGALQQPHPFGQLDPILNEGILKIAGTENFCHRFLLLN